MIEIRKKVVNLGKREYKGQLLDCVSIEWLYDGLPVHVCVAGPDHYVKAEKVEIWIGLDEPESPGNRRYKILAMHGYSIDTVGIVESGVGMLQSNKTTEVDVFYLDETKPQINLFGITRTIEGLGCKEDLPLSEYLADKKEQV